MSNPMSPDTGTATSGTATSGTDAAKSAAHQTAGSAKEQAHQVAASSSEQAHQVAEHAREQAGAVTEEARRQAKHLVSTTTSEVNGQLEQRLSAAAGSARDTASQLRAMAEGRTEEAGQVGEWVRRAGDELERLADRADELGLRGVTDEITGFARRRPVAFLVGAAAAGVLAGRVARAGKEAAAEHGDDDARRTPTTEPIPGSAYQVAGPATDTLGGVRTPDAGAAGTPAPVAPVADPLADPMTGLRGEVR